MKETIKTQAELNDLNNALLHAVNSVAMLDETEDGGTCNIDHHNINNINFFNH